MSDHFMLSSSPRAKQQAGLRQWYLGDADMAPKRFCGGRLKRGPFICLHVSIAIILILLIVIPILTAVVVPRSIQTKFAASLGGSSASSTTVFAVTNSANGEFNVTATISAATFLPGTATIDGPFTLALSDASGKGWATITVADAVSFPINHDATVTLSARLVVYDTPSPALLTAFASSKELATTVTTSWTIRLWGFVWYRDLSLQGVHTVRTNNSFNGMFASAFAPTSSATAKTTVAFLANGVNNFRVTTTIAPLSTLPGTITIASPLVFSVADSTGAGWANVSFLDPIALPLYAPASLALDGQLKVYRFPSAISLYGRVWYTRLPLQADVNINSLLGSTIWSAITSLLS
ncbi:hypothetical protein SPRG_08517 [Saprolegnia parasitica CBS 223.65]|uniref:Uncharacterized protein n=1 Tax=Saprolegnia parasitica (strain CBS 223.65) TaxID=695850 RepID=A0A067CHZ4_SAPPC|nr:hypothetical protein SPRG_08517 [Saprolegnia parasitica CBS 223.65]KDO26156.1 hypothetical protein SPRG_08517 [Saprolegnia parasitica CBS 223.65]|eukprot:XP_012203150.1 hypothetical protein SPRG_08517 [Saprolegnia parasitica CBS 223.65]